ncbi:MAG TPA: PadR family transcriptional regulator [Bryobacteraceae bacterium]|nr:PadR family transcriptional regulator [Bryobacteraceae bacterium]
MPERINLTYTSGLILHAIATGQSYGFDIIDYTGLPSGTVYPALRRLEFAGLIESVWDHKNADKSGGPPRKYYRLTRPGRDHLHTLRARYPLLEKIAD